MSSRKLKLLAMDSPKEQEPEEIVLRFNRPLTMLERSGLIAIIDIELRR